MYVIEMKLYLRYFDIVKILVNWKKMEYNRHK